jgi:hypothetical protein
MTVRSLNNTFRDLASGDNLSPSQKSSLLTQYNSSLNTNVLANQLGYLPTYGATTYPSRSAVQVINSAFDTSGNGGRKLVRLSNGTLVATVKTPASTVILYKSTDGGGTWSALVNPVSPTSLQDVSITTNGTYIYVLVNFNSASVWYGVYNTSGVQVSGAYLDNNTQTAMGNCSITYSQSDNTLHAAWASKNATYPNSFNIRYAKGTINSDGSVTWGSVIQVSTVNTVNTDVQSPSIVAVNGNPAILFTINSIGGTSQNVCCSRWSSGSFVSTYPYTVSAASYYQTLPSATVDGTGTIHVVWQGYDSTDSTYYNIRYAKSTDGGSTWTIPIKLTNGNLYNQQSPSITCNQYGGLYVYWYGTSGSSNGFYRIRTINYNGSAWSAYTDVTTNTTANILYPSVCDNVRTFNSPLVIWQDNVTPSVKFSGDWTDTPLLAETTSTSMVSNKDLIDKVIAKGIGARTQIVTVTSSSTTSYFPYIGSGSTSVALLTVTGLPFKPTFIYAFRNSGGIVDTSTYSELGGDLYPKPVKLSINFNTGYNSSAGTYHIKGDVAPASVVNGSFTIPVASPNATYTCLIIG